MAFSSRHVNPAGWPSTVLPQGSPICRTCIQVQFDVSAPQTAPHLDDLFLHRERRELESEARLGSLRGAGFSMMRSRSRASAASATSTVKSTKTSCLRTNALAASEASGGPLSCVKKMKRTACTLAFGICGLRVALHACIPRLLLFGSCNNVDDWPCDWPSGQHAIAVWL